MNGQQGQRTGRWLGLAAVALALVACGGSGEGRASVSNVTASGAQYGRTMTITVSGSGLATPELSLAMTGPCSDIKRTVSNLDYQTVFTCLVDGAGTISPMVRDEARGLTLGQVWVDVPVPQVTFAVSQGSRSGSFVLELDPSAAPITALNFIRQVHAGVYNGTIFHRVLPGRIAQGGQYTTDYTLRDALYPPIKLESDNGLKNLRGTIAMARTSEPDSATAQFFINTIDNPTFDHIDDGLPGYAVFGRVISGLDVVDEIVAVPVFTVNAEFPSRPVDNVVMNLVFQTR